MARLDFRSALEAYTGVPVVYNNDGNAAALYAHYQYFGEDAPLRSSVAAIVGTGLGGGVVEAGRVVKGAAGMAGELGHVHIPMEGLLAEGQPIPSCNCGFSADGESVASLSAISPFPVFPAISESAGCAEFDGFPVDRASQN